MTTPCAYFDTECYPNYWLLKFRVKGRELYTFELFEGQRFSPQQAQNIALLFKTFPVVSFNGINYDVPQICAAMRGDTPAELKLQNDRIIVEGVRHWQLDLPEWSPRDHVDLIEVAPGRASQKMYAARMHRPIIWDLPYDPGTALTPEQCATIAQYCENDLQDLEAIHEALAPQIKLRRKLGDKYGVDLRSKSDAQMAESVIKLKCEQASGRRIGKPVIDWTTRFSYDPPDYIQFKTPELVEILDRARRAVFTIRPPASMRERGEDEKGRVIAMPAELEGVTITIGRTTYSIGIGGLHSNEESASHISDDDGILRDSDVEGYYPELMLNSRAFPPALGSQFLETFAEIKRERIANKHLQKRLEKSGVFEGEEYDDAEAGNGGGKIMVNGTFGKCGSAFSVLFAPKMLIQTTLTGQLSLLMLIEWLEFIGVPVVSANTDGIVTKCPRHLVQAADAIISEWERRSSLKMETVEYSAIYSRDVNSYFAVKAGGGVKRKGEFGLSGLTEKKNPDVEICSDAVAKLLEHGTPYVETILSCSDLRKFLTVQRVSGGGVKMWGEGVRKGTLVRDMIPELQRAGWIKCGRNWERDGYTMDARDAYVSLFEPQRPEYLGKVVRWYYSTQAPGSIVYATNGNTVSLSYGAKPCQRLPDTFPDDIDYAWYFEKCESILKSIAFSACASE
jgi:hypothetical protein